MKDDYGDDFMKDDFEKKIEVTQSVKEALPIAIEPAKEPEESFGVSRRQTQLARAKELRAILTMEEEKNNNLYELDYNNRNYAAFTEMAKGMFRSVLTQTAEKSSSGSQTEVV